MEKKRRLMYRTLIGAGIVALAVALVLIGRQQGIFGARAPAKKPHVAAVPVQVAQAKTGDMPISLQALATVTARKTMTITPRVDGLIEQVRFSEGQYVKAHQVLDILDPRPFQVVVDQWVGQLQHDEAVLADAQLDLKRYQGLLAHNSVSGQQVDTQLALVHQDEGTVLSDRAQLANARLQLDFSRVKAPISGRVGLRLVDAGNMVHASGTTGLVVITQTEPIDVVFPIAEDSLDGVRTQMRNNKKPLAVDVYDRTGSTWLARGKLMSVDNLINVSTGTVNLKAAFANLDERLFPNEFVNVRLRMGALHHVVLLPVAAVQTGPNGAYVFVVGTDNVVHMRTVKEGVVNGETASILAGVQAGERVVTDGVDRLREGSKVLVVDISNSAGVAHHKRHAAGQGGA